MNLRNLSRQVGVLGRLHQDEKSFHSSKPLSKVMVNLGLQAGSGDDVQAIVPMQMPGG